VMMFGQGRQDNMGVGFSGGTLGEGPSGRISNGTLGLLLSSGLISGWPIESPDLCLP
jgi:hypothetical protein